MFELSQLMPDSKGANFYTVDPDLAFLLKRYLTEEDFEHARECSAAWEWWPRSVWMIWL